MKPKLLITGSKGLIGQVLTKSLSDNFDIYGMDIIGSENEKYFIADISKIDQIDTVFKKINNIQYIVHLAAASTLDSDWQSVLKNNIIGLHNVYESARKNKVKKIVFASSNHVAGMYEGVPPVLHKKENPRIISINDKLCPDSDYGASKAFGETVARQYFDLHGIQSICLRIGSVLKDNDPNTDRLKKTWLSYNDLIQLVTKSLLSDVKFGIYYGVSNNKGRFWDISNAEKEIGYIPKDDASLL